MKISSSQIYFNIVIEDFLQKLELTCPCNARKIPQAWHEVRGRSRTCRMTREACLGYPAALRP